MINVSLLREIQAHILAHPEQLDMSTFRTDCGTIGCIALHACKLSGEPADFRKVVQRRGQVLLGLNSDQSGRLFIPVSDLIHDFPGTMIHARRVSDHIDSFIAEYEE